MAPQSRLSSRPRFSNRSVSWLSLLAAVGSLLACSGVEDGSSDSGGVGGGVAAGGALGTGGIVTTGGTGPGTGGGVGPAGGAIGSGGVGAATGGQSSGGAGSDTGGALGSGGASSSGGAAAGGAAAGGAPSGGASSTGGSSATCPLPEQFKWTSTGPLAEPKGANWKSLKDFTITRHDDHYVLYATFYDTNWSGYFSQFTSFDQMKDAEQITRPGQVAPHIMYFTPKDIWVLSYQWGFKYATSTNPSDPNSWSATKSLLNGDPTNGTGTGPIDQTLICDDSDCYIFFAGDNGHIYRASMPIGNFPGTFSNATSILQDTAAKIFEGVEVYKVKGSEKYLMLIEAYEGGPRFFRAFTADSLSGTWTPMAKAATPQTPFAGKQNVTFTSGAWTDDISHGDLVREDPSELKEVDMCNLQMIYQGRDPKVNVDYGLLPYRPGLLTLTK